MTKMLSNFREHAMKPSVKFEVFLAEDSLGHCAKSISPELQWVLEDGKQVMVLTGGDYSKRFQADMNDSLVAELQEALNDLGKSLLNRVKG